MSFVQNKPLTGETQKGMLGTDKEMNHDRETMHIGIGHNALGSAGLCNLASRRNHVGDWIMSETVKHTPGNWRVDDSVHGPNEGIIHVRAGENSNPEICTLWASSLIMKAGDDGLAENYANARLIAAAPEMLDSGRKLANEVGGLVAFEDEIRAAIGNTNWSVLMQRLAEAEAAIAKATGGQ